MTLHPWKPASRRHFVQDVFILSASRTPTAKFGGSFSRLSAPELGATAIRSALKKSGVPSDLISGVYMGNVLQGNVGLAPARQAALLAGLPTNVDATTVNKVCSSGLKAVALAAQNIQLGLARAQVAGGMESMSRAPYYLPRLGGPGQLPSVGDVRVEDGIVRDALWDVFGGTHVGICGETTAKNHCITREEQDEYSISSYRRAQQAWKENRFAEEIAPVTVIDQGEERLMNHDEGYGDLAVQKLLKLKPAFLKNGTGTITAGNASTMNDGASALVLGDEDVAQEFGNAGASHSLARIVSTADAALDPVDFPVAPARAIPLALKRAGISQDKVAAWEINEAFAAVVLANTKILGLKNARVNSYGGAISLGHALGSSGARILVTLLHQLQPGEYGVAAICNGGGGATAMVVQKLDRVN